MKQPSDDIVIVEGSNELNIQMVPVAVPPEFIGFSLMVENPVAGGYYWFADFPYSAYTVRISNFMTVNDAGWVTQEAPGWDYIRIVFLDTNYLCPVGDPHCEGLIFYLRFEDGHHYILDCATGVLRENPNPPPGPPEPIEEPRVIDVTIPSVASGGEFSPTIRAYLPEIYPGKTYWLFRAEARPVRGVTTVASGQFISSAQLASKYNWIPLNKADGIYTLTGICTGAGCEPAKAVRRWYQVIWRTEPLLPGSYPVQATAISSQYFIDQYGDAGLFGSITYDLGIVGILVVT